MTCREKLAMEHPDCIGDFDGGCSGCPSTYGYLPRRENCLGIDCGKCWDREIPGTLPMQYPIDTAAEAELAKPEPQWTKENPHINFTPDGEGTPIAKILDSGNRTEFATGAVRDMREGKGRCDLMPLGVVGDMMIHCDDKAMLHNLASFLELRDTDYLKLCIQDFARHTGGCDTLSGDLCTIFLEVAKHFEEGAKKYGENNWQKGIPVHCYIDSAVRHYLKWLRGDKDEPHDRAFVWNLMCCIWEVDYHTKTESE